MSPFGTERRFAGDTSVDAVMVLPDDSYLFNLRRHIVENLASAKLPSMFGLREAVEEGGLMSYGESLGRSHFRAAYFVDPAVYVPSTTFSVMHRDKLAQIALSHRLPTLYGFREFAEAGGLMSYGANLLDAYRRAATFVDKILKGSRPSDLPVEQPTRFELVINARTAKALGIEVPPTLVALADEVIE